MVERETELTRQSLSDKQSGSTQLRSGTSSSVSRKYVQQSLALRIGLASYLLQSSGLSCSSRAGADHTVFNLPAMIDLLIFQMSDLSSHPFAAQILELWVHLMR